MITQAANSRVDQAVFQSRPFFVHVDEYHSFTTDAMAGMLSELRKFKVGLVLAGQHSSQGHTVQHVEAWLLRSYPGSLSCGDCQDSKRNKTCPSHSLH